MATYKEEAIVLHAHDLGEADRIVSLITSGRGLRRAVAKGVKRTASRFGARLEPFTHLHVVLHEGRNLDTVTQADIITSHAPLRDDFEAFLFGEAMLEIIEKSMQENQNIPRLFDMLRVSLDALEREPRDPALLLAAFQLKVCALVGYHPHLERCLHCQREARGEGIRLDLAGGGVFCPACRGESGSSIPLSPECLELMRSVMSEVMSRIAGMEAGKRLSRELLGVSYLYAENFLERQLRSRPIVLGYLDAMSREKPA